MEHNTPTPMRFWDALGGHQLTAAMKTAIELDLFTAVASGDGSVDAIAVTTKASPKGIRVLCDFLTIQGFLLKTDSNYALTQDSAVFLDRRSPAYMGGVTTFMLGPTIRAAFEGLTEAVKKGGTALSEHGTMETDHPAWVDFAHSMTAMTTMAAKYIGDVVGPVEKVLDIAAGHGMYGLVLGQRNATAEIYACDWSKVLEVAQENAEKMGLAARFHQIQGSAFEVDFGTGYDVILFTNFFHHFDESTCESLMKKALAALKPGGCAATLEFVPNPDRVSPPPAGGFSLIMLATTAKGDAYTFGEYDTMFKNAGFARSELHDVPMSPQRLIVSFK